MHVPSALAPSTSPSGHPWAVLILALAASCAGTPRADTPVRTHRDTPRLALGPRLAIPGTGVSLEAPARAALLPMGPGLAVDDLDLTIMVALAAGPEPVHAAFWHRLFAEGTGARRREFTVEGQPATLGRDVLLGPPGAVARAWLVTRRGARTLAVLATFRDGRDEDLEALVVSSLRTLHWDETRRLSPDRAIGVALGEVEGLEMDRTTLGTLALTPGAVPFPPPEGEPMMFVLPLAEAPARARSLATCSELLERTGAVSIPAGAPALLEAPREGCFHEGLHRTRSGEELYAYAAVIVISPGPILLTGMVRPALREEWAPRFAEATATLRHLRQPAD